MIGGCASTASRSVLSVPVVASDTATSISSIGGGTTTAHVVDESALVEFIAQTGVDEAFARDLLQGKKWDLIGALKAYQSLCGLHDPTSAAGDDVNQPKLSFQLFPTSIDNDTVPPLATFEECDTTASDCQTMDRVPSPQVTNRAGGGYMRRNPMTDDNANQRPHTDPEDEEEASFNRLTRGFSKTGDNFMLVQNARRHVATGINRNAVTVGRSPSKPVKLARASVNTNSTSSHCHVETPSYTFTLPNMYSLESDFRQFLEKDLIETSTLKGLESSGNLNWWASTGAAQRLWPLATSGDGNCLLHAASLGMWGFHDRLLVLRKALYLILTKGSRRHALWRRWRWQQTHINKESGLLLSEEEWRTEWEALVRLASTQPRSKPGSAEPVSAAISANDESERLALPNQPSSTTIATEADQCSSVDGGGGEEILYESLEDIHVFALAHVLKRPILVVADKTLKNADGEDFAPIPFGGIYLPVECPPEECHRSPLVLCYDAAHFSALVVMQRKSNNDSFAKAVIPITDRERRLLPLHFAADPGPDFTWWKDDKDERIAASTFLSDEQRLVLICRYMDIVQLNVRRPSSTAGRRDDITTTAAVSIRPVTIVPSPRSIQESALSRLSGSLTDLSNKLDDNGNRKFSLNGFTNSLKRKLNIGGRRQRHKSASRSSSDRHHKDRKAATLPTPMAGRNSVTVSISMGELRDLGYILAAKLTTDSHHQYMDEMVQNYLRSARQRFDREKRQRTNGANVNGSAAVAGRQERRRERISRSFSTNSIVVTCMNGDCDRSASHSTNFLCEDCFQSQRRLMASFSMESQAHLDSPTKCRTLPARCPSSVAADEDENGADSKHGDGEQDRLMELPGAAAAPLPVTRGASSLTVRQPIKEGETRFGVNAVTNIHGITHYYLPQFCRSPHCANYSNGHPTLCSTCDAYQSTKEKDK